MMLTSHLEGKTDFYNHDEIKSGSDVRGFYSQSGVQSVEGEKEHFRKNNCLS